MLHDRDSKFSAPFDEVFRSAGAAAIKTPIRAPNANAFAERWVRTVRSECLDWLLIVSRRQLERALRTCVDHYNHQRPHRALALETPIPRADRVSLPQPTPTPEHVHRRNRLGGLPHEYQRAT